jgi:predicted nucleic acid-binding protein
MSRAYYDANYLFKLQCLENGSAEVRAHAATVHILCIAAHGRAEYASAAFRKVREGSATPQDYRLALAQVKADAATGNLQFLPLTDSVIDRIETVFATAPATTYLRAADALHLATAAEHGFTEIHSNDKHLLAAALLFGIAGVNVIP